MADLTPSLRQNVSDALKAYKETYGIREQASVASFVANQPDSTNGYRGTAVGTTGVLATFDQPSPPIGAYPDRDSVAVYVANTAPAPMGLSVAGAGSTTYTSTTVTSASGGLSTWKQQDGTTAFDLRQVRPGTLIDTKHTPKKWTGIVSSVNPTTGVITVGGWYKQDDLSGSPSTPTADGSQAVINPVTKVWAMNTDTFLGATSYARNATGIEVDASIQVSGSAVSGVDSVNMGTDFVAGGLASGYYSGNDAMVSRGVWLCGFTSSGPTYAGVHVTFFPTTNGVGHAAGDGRSPTYGFLDDSDSTNVIAATGGTHTNFLNFQNSVGGTVTTLDYAGNFTTKGNIVSSNGMVQGIAGEIRNASASVYIDFTKHATDDFHFRMILTDSTHLALISAGDSTGIKFTETGGKIDLIGGGYVSGKLRNVNTNAGAPTGGTDGDMVVDTTNNRFYIRVGGAWKYAALT